MNNNDNKEPLYKWLNAKRTQGVFKIDYDHSHGSSPFTLVVGNCNTGINWQQIAVVDSQDDAKYIALAVNNLHHLAGMLEKIFKIENAAFSLNGFDVERLKKEIGETLKRIS